LCHELLIFKIFRYVMHSNSSIISASCQQIVKAGDMKTTNSLRRNKKTLSNEKSM
jgi:hypothetical protein